MTFRGPNSPIKTLYNKSMSQTFSRVLLLPINTFSRILPLPYHLFHLLQDTLFTQPPSQRYPFACHLFQTFMMKYFITFQISTNILTDPIRILQKLYFHSIKNLHLKSDFFLQRLHLQTVNLTLHCACAKENKLLLGKVKRFFSNCL